MRCFQCNMEIEEEKKDHYGLHPSCFQESFGVDGLYEFSDIARMPSNYESPDGGSTERVDIASSFFQGKFRKYAAKLAGESYILKVEEDEYPELPTVEYLCNQIALLLGMLVPDFQLICFHNASSLAVRNFIRPGRKEVLHHIYHFLEGSDFNCETVIRIIRERTRRLPEIERFVFLCLFDSLVGNHDRHGRNLALIEEAGKYRLAPFYDNPSYIGIENAGFLPADHSPKGRIATCRNPEPVMADYIEEFTRLGFANVVEEFRHQAQLEKLMALSGWDLLSSERAESLRRLIAKRTEQLHHDG